MAIKDFSEDIIGEPITGEPQSIRKSAILTIVESICFESPDQEPTHCQNAYDKAIDTEEFPYQRSLKITDKWIPLDFGSLSSISTLHITCIKPQLQVIPSEEDQKLNSQKLLEISGPPNSAGEFLPLLILSPGESMRIIPSSPSNLYIRARVDSVRIHLLVLPGDTHA